MCSSDLGIEKVRQRVQQNGTLAKQLQLAQQQLARLTQTVQAARTLSRQKAAGQKAAGRQTAGQKTRAPQAPSPDTAARRAMNTNTRR